MGRFDDPIATVPVGDPLGEAWSAYVYGNDPQPLIDLGVLSPDTVPTPSEDEVVEKLATILEESPDA